LFDHLKTSPRWGEVPFLCPKILTNQGLGLLQNALFNDHIHVFSSQIERFRWNLPAKLKHFPAIRIHYIGIDKRYRGLGYGRYLLAEAIYVIEQIAQNSGCNFITVEALNSAVGFYEKYGFVIRQRGTEYQNMVLKLDELWTS
jgi:ribosomal protein S18 acetylase RimI-like enzyme